MEYWQNGWAAQMVNDFSEYRGLWYRDRAVGIYDKRNVDIEADDQIDAHALEVVKSVIDCLTTDQRIALECHLKLRTVSDMQAKEVRLEHAQRGGRKVLVAQLVVGRSPHDLS
jgi:hypothetical protein